MDFLIIAGIAAGICFLVWWFAIKKPGTPPDWHNTNRPAKPVLTEVSNDKVIVISDIASNDIKQALTQFCNLYNNTEYTVFLRLTVYLRLKSAVTFPYNISFDHFCFCVNYLVAPHDISLKKEYTPDVRGFCKIGFDKTIPEPLHGKNVMVFIPAWDDEHDVVYLSTKDGLGFKYGFDGSWERLNQDLEPYQNPVTLSDVPTEVLDFE